MRINRRSFLKRTSVSLAAGATLSTLRAADTKPVSSGGDQPLIVSTWGFGKPANDAALKVLLGGGTILDAVEQGIWVPESDRGNSSVGLGGMPNAARAAMRAHLAQVIDSLLFATEERAIEEARCAAQAKRARYPQSTA